jgi:hypothetical protein
LPRQKIATAARVVPHIDLAHQCHFINFRGWVGAMPCAFSLLDCYVEFDLTFQGLGVSNLLTIPKQ